MDGQRFDQFTRAWSGRAVSRREMLRLVGGGIVASLLGVVGRAGVAAQTCLAEGEVCHSSDQCCLGRCKKKKGHTRGHCSCPATRQCETFCCGSDHFCCNPQDQICCPSDAQCCNPGDGTGSCCAAPGSCATTFGDDTGPTTCCPPERTFLTSANIPECCPAGTVAVGGVTTNGGPCCPEAAACNGSCCSSGSVCVNGSCCAETNVCGSQCCSTAYCYGCNNGTCSYQCLSNQYCAFGGTCKDCPLTGCGG